ncbi:MAG: hypothetical protein ACYDFU_07680 [Nitrospirota bacterium]
MKRVIAVLSTGLIACGLFVFIFSRPVEATKTYFTPHKGVIPAAWLNTLNNVVFDGNTGINGHYAKINLTGGANVIGNLPWTMLDLTYGNLHNLPLRNYTSLQGIPRSAGLIKSASNGTLSTAVAGADYAPATSGTSILKGNGSGGFSGAVAGTDYQAAITASGILKGAGGGSVSAATSGTDYAPATSGTSILKGNGSGGFSSAASGTDYAPATSGMSILKGNGSGGFSSAVSGTDFAPATAGTSILKGDGSGGFLTAVSGTDYQVPIAIRQRGTAEATFGNVSGIFSGDGSHLTGIPSQNGGTVTSVSVNTANGFGGTVSNATTTPAISINTGVHGLLFGNGTSVSAVAYTSSYLASDVSISSANTFYQGPSITLAPGTWLVMGYLTLDNTNATYAVVMSIRLGDDANSKIGSESQAKLSTSWSAGLSVSQIVTVGGGNETWSLDAAENTNYTGRYIRATCPANGTAGKGSYICALRIQ